MWLSHKIPHIIIQLKQSIYFRKVINPVQTLSKNEVINNNSFSITICRYLVEVLHKSKPITFGKNNPLSSTKLSTNQNTYQRNSKGVVLGRIELQKWRKLNETYLPDRKEINTYASRSMIMLKSHFILFSSTFSATKQNKPIHTRPKRIRLTKPSLDRPLIFNDSSSTD